MIQKEKKVGPEIWLNRTSQVLYACEALGSIPGTGEKKKMIKESYREIAHTYLIVSVQGFIPDIRESPWHQV